MNGRIYGFLDFIVSLASEFRKCVLMLTHFLAMFPFTRPPLPPHSSWKHQKTSQRRCLVWVYRISFNESVHVDMWWEEVTRNKTQAKKGEREYQKWDHNGDLQWKNLDSLLHSAQLKSSFISYENSIIWEWHSVFRFAWIHFCLLGWVSPNGKRFLESQR